MHLTVDVPQWLTQKDVLIPFTYALGESLRHALSGFDFQNQNQTRGCIVVRGRSAAGRGHLLGRRNSSAEGRDRAVEQAERTRQGSDEARR